MSIWYTFDFTARHVVLYSQADSRGNFAVTTFNDITISSWFLFYFIEVCLNQLIYQGLSKLFVWSS
jgi:hypothetical protein